MMMHHQLLKINIYFSQKIHQNYIEKTIYYGLVKNQPVAMITD